MARSIPRPRSGPVRRALVARILALALAGCTDTPSTSSSAGGAGLGGHAGAGLSGAGPGQAGNAGFGGSGAASGGSGGAPGGGSGATGGTSGASGGGLGGNGGAAGNVGFPIDATPIVLTGDGGWCWFEGPRALFVGERLIVGSVAAGFGDAGRRGDIEAIVHDFETNQTSVIELHSALELDDHDSPAFLVRPDGRLLSLYAKHGSENRFYYRISEADLLSWGSERTFTPTAATRLTYSNLFLLPAEQNRIYDFYRGLDNSYKPSYAYSDDLGESFQSGNVVIDVPSTELHRPYVRYVSNGSDTVHLVYTEAHPRDYDNSLYHVFYRAGMLHRSDGSAVRALGEGLASPDEGTRIFEGDADNVAWVIDVALDAEGRPVTAYSVQVGSAGLPVGQGGDDIRYRYARWDGTAWRDFPLAFAGSRLYSGEDDYSGLAAVDPEDVSVVYISTNADPASGAPLVSAGDGARHYELFRGVTPDGGATWQWTAVTRDSTEDNLRPIVLPRSASGRRALLWLRGVYRSYTDYEQEVVAILWNE